MLAQLGIGPSWLYLGIILGLCWVLFGRLGPMLAPAWDCVGRSWVLCWARQCELMKIKERHFQLFQLAQGEMSQALFMMLQWRTMHLQKLALELELKA